MENVWEADFNDLFEQHYQPLVAYINTHTNDLEMAEDIVQGCYCKFWEKRHQLMELESPRSYLYKMAYNTFINHYRHSKRRDDLAQQLEAEALLTMAAESDAAGDEHLEELHRAIAMLPNKCREILVMSKLQGMSYKEIASTMNISVKTVESQMRLAFQKIRENFNQDVFIMLMFSGNMTFKELTS